MTFLNFVRKWSVKHEVVMQMKSVCLKMSLAVTAAFNYYFSNGTLMRLK